MNMDVIRKLTGYFIQYLLPVVFAVLFTVWITSMPNILTALNKCPPSTTLTFCNALFYAVVFAVSYFVLAFIIGFIWEFPATVTKWKKARDPKNLKLKPGKLNKHARLDLIIENKEWRISKVNINAVYVDHQEHERRSVASALNSVEIKKKERQTVSFIIEEPQGGFLIVEHFDGEKPEDIIYSFGTHKFVVIIVFGFGSGRNEQTNSYDVTVNYTKLHEFKVNVNPRNENKK
jgi:hypothetical protein